MTMNIKHLQHLIDVCTKQPKGYKEFTIRFGKYNGKKVKDVPGPYLEWALKATAPYIYVTCGECGATFDETRDLPEDNVTDIASDYRGRDVLYFICPKCKKQTESLRLG